ncbi:hypothetical protein PGT21_009125 [Puccinia graminis f. sp. tritici]|uniref:Uncharacterized protein n=1 Tax=Puccinia graminis f. sp. tritici TaxID=56615 RepID=A0A5B0PA86_PUCGR|nr:hypothetical protein PGT21_009125 [Puccinia graminis f. sp. tritici]
MFGMGGGKKERENGEEGWCPFELYRGRLDWGRVAAALAGARGSSALLAECTAPVLHIFKTSHKRVADPAAPHDYK